MATLRALTVAACATILHVSGAHAQATDAGPWRIGAWSGAYVPFSSLIKTADTDDTGLAAGPAFALEARYRATNSVSVYASGLAAFGTIRPGSSIRPAVVGPTNRATLIAGTAGVVLVGDGWLGAHLQPTLRLGGGLKAYSFDLTDAEGQIRPTADVGIGLLGVGVGALDVAVEVRYLPSTFDQEKLPIRGIEPQDQRQSDLMLSVGIGIRP